LFNRFRFLAPNDVFIISTIDKRIDFPVFIVTKQDSAFDAFAKESSDVSGNNWSFFPFCSTNKLSPSANTFRV